MPERRQLIPYFAFCITLKQNSFKIFNIWNILFVFILNILETHYNITRYNLNHLNRRLRHNQFNLRNKLVFNYKH